MAQYARHREEHREEIGVPKKQKITPQVGVVLLVGLSDADSKKYEAILRHKRSISDNSIDIISRSCDADKRVLDDFGEVAATKIKQSQKHLSDEEISQIVELYKTGKSTYALAEQFDCHRSTISAALKSSGITPDKGRTRKNLDADVGSHLP